MATDIVELVARYRAEGQDTVRKANRDVATTGKEAESATEGLSAAQKRRTGVDRDVTASAQGVARETKAVTTATREAERGTVGATRALTGMEREAKDVTRAMTGLGSTMGRTSGVTRTLDDDITRAGTAAGRFDMRGMSMQLSQVAQQGSATGNYLQALAIQLPDIGLAFGTVGIAAGVAAGALLPLAANLLRTGDDAEDAEDGVDRFTSALDRFQGYADRARSSTRDLREEYGRFAEVIRRDAMLLARSTASQAINNVNSGTFTGAFQEINRILDAMDGVTANLREQEAAGVATTEQLQLMREVLQGYQDDAYDAAHSLGLSVGEARRLQPLLDRLSGAEGMEGFADAATEVIEEIDGIYEGASILPPKIHEFLEGLISARDAAASAATVMDDIARTDITSGISRAATEAERLAKNILSAYNDAQSLSQISLEAFAGSIGMGGLYQTPTGIPEWVTRMGESYISQMEAAEKGILELIAHVESGGDYNATLDNGKWTGGPKDLVNMTLSEVLALGDRMRTPENRATYAGGGSSALGRYQIVGTTMRGLIAELGLDPNTTTYNPEIQDRMAQQLLRRRRGQGVEGLRNEWQGLQGVPTNLINEALGNQPVARVDPQVEAQQTRAAAEAVRDKAEADREAERAELERTRATEASQRALDGLRGSQDPAIAAAQEYARAQEVVKEALDRGQISTGEAAQAIAQAREEYQQTIAEIDERGRSAYEGLVASYDKATAAAHEFARAQEVVKEALDQGHISAGEAAQAIALARQEYQQTMAEIAEEAAKLEDNAKRGADAMTGLFMSITDGADSARDAIAQLLMQIATGFVTRGFEGLAASGAGGGFFSALGGLLDFDGGGYTGNGSRSGGVDGKGGFPAILHPQETVIDHTKGQGSRQTVDVRLVGGDLVLSDSGQIVGQISAKIDQSSAATERRTLGKVPGFLNEHRDRLGYR